MSASDAAPLPRLGEVFFDVKGNSRSMRLSWYADTDVAVFSIWQGGKCTGTFRLPMDDLSRMIEILRRGPEGRSARTAGERRPAERSLVEHRPVERGTDDPGFSGGYEADNTVVHNPGPRTSAGGASDYGAGQFGTGDFSSREFGAQGPADYGSDTYGATDYGPDYRGPDYRSAERPSADRYGPDDYIAADQAPPEYGDQGRPRRARHRTERNEPADYGRPAYEGRPDYEQGSEWWQDEDQYEADRTGQRFVRADDAGYGQERFVPPYVRPGPESSEPGFMDDSEYRPPADPAGRSRHSAGRHSGREGR